MFWRPGAHKTLVFLGFCNFFAWFSWDVSGFVCFFCIFRLFCIFAPSFQGAGGPTWRRPQAGENAKKCEKCKKTKNAKDILRKPCEKAAKTCVFLGLAPIGGPKPMKTQGFLIQMRSNLVFSQVWGLRWVQNLGKHMVF